jgi:hypothetical protein
MKRLLPIRPVACLGRAVPVGAIETGCQEKRQIPFLAEPTPEFEMALYENEREDGREP